MKMDQILEGLKGIIVIHDDITIFGEDNDDHDNVTKASTIWLQYKIQTWKGNAASGCIVKITKSS